MAFTRARLSQGRIVLLPQSCGLRSELFARTLTHWQWGSWSNGPRAGCTCRRKTDHGKRRKKHDQSTCVTLDRGVQKGARCGLRNVEMILDAMSSRSTRLTILETKHGPGVYPEPRQTQSRMPTSRRERGEFLDDSGANQLIAERYSIERVNRFHHDA